MSVSDSIPHQGRILGVDPGTRRIGIALSDPDRILAQPLTTVSSRGARRDVEEIQKLAREHQVVGIVVGLPLNMDGTRGAAAEAAEALMNRLRAATGLPVVPWDERLSSVEATRTLIRAGVRRETRRKSGAVDRVAASLILESFLASLESRDDDQT
jgi:putative pre-16S rRNA nuclease